MCNYNKCFNFIGMIRMLKILVIIVLSSLAVNGQIYTRPNNSYGVIMNRHRPDSTQLVPTFCGVPSGKASLHSIDQKMSALYYDSCGHSFYVYDPSDSSWTKSGATQLNDSTIIVGRDTITIRGTGGGADNSIATGSRTATGDYIQDWLNHWFFLNNIKALEANSYRADDNHPGNKKRFRFFSDSTIDTYPLQLMWGLKNVNEDFTDSLHFELTSTKDLTYLYHYGNGGGKSIEMDWDAGAFYPNTKIYANGNSRSGYYEFGASTAEIHPQDSTLIKAVPAANADSVLGIRALSNGVNTVVKFPTSAISGGGSALDTTTIYENINLKLNKLDTVTFETSGSDTLVYIGTSITVGTGTTSTQYRYSTWATKFLKKYGYGFKELNMGASGSQLTHQIGNIPRKRIGLRLLVIEFGTNELNTSVDSATYRTNQTTFIDTCIARGWATSELAIISQMGSQIGAVGTAAQQRGMNFVDSTNCLVRGITYIDAWNPELTAGYTYIIANPDIHPSDEQAMVLGEIVASGLSKMIQYNNEGNELVLDGRAQFGNAIIKNRKFIAAPQLLGIDSVGNVGVTTTLPANISTQGEMILRGGLVLQGYGQRAEATQRNLTDYNSSLDFYMGKGSRIIQNVGGFQSTLIPMATNGQASWGSNYSLGLNLDFQQINLNGPSLLGGKVTVSTNSYFESAQGGTTAGNRIFTSEGGTADMIFKNRFSSGSTYFTTTNGTHGVENIALKIFPSGAIVKQSGGTANEINVSEFTINSTSKGILIPRMSGAQRNAIVVGKISSGGMAITSAGSSYTDGSYTGISVTGGTGSGATIAVNFSGGIAVAITLMNPGTGYLAGDILSVNSSDVGGTGSGFQATIRAIQEDGLLIFNNETHKPNWYNAATGWYVPADSASAGGSSYTFANGLTESSGTVKLGGAQTNATTITSGTSGWGINYTGINDYLDGPQFNVVNSGSVGIAIHGESANGRGVEGYATSGAGVYGLATNGAALYGTATTGTALDISVTDESGNALINGLITGSNYNTLAPWGAFTRATSGTAAAGLGGSFDFYLQNSSGSSVNTGSLSVALTDAAPSTITSKIQITNADNGIVNPVFTIEGKSMQFNQYGSGAITGTASKIAGFTSGGNIIELPLSGFYGSLAVLNDADHTVTSTESSIRYHNNITASRTVTIPDPSAATNREIWIKWNTINGGSSLNITTTSGTALIYLDGTASSSTYNITASFQSALLKSDGTSWYKVN